MTPNEQLLKEWAMEGGHLNRMPIIHGIYGPYFAGLFKWRVTPSFVGLLIPVIITSFSILLVFKG